ncbi:hypothetical protein GF342_05355 [Candidatus Woesearchaeota archaeon]|nr:hypothetical protein [Candidatus Woesearchaeota archaeon]
MQDIYRAVARPMYDMLALHGFQRTEPSKIMNSTVFDRMQRESIVVKYFVTFFQEIGLRRPSRVGIGYEIYRNGVSEKFHISRQIAAFVSARDSVSDFAENTFRRSLETVLIRERF